MDPLEILNSLSTEDLQNTDTSFPNLNPSQYEFIIDSAELKESERTGGRYLLFGTKLNSPDATSTNGDPIQPGYPVRHMINLTPSQKQIDKHGEEQCIKNIKRDLAKFLEAVMGPDRTWLGVDGLEGYRGLTFFAKTRVSKERTDEATGQTYDPQTEFSSFIPKTESVDHEAINAAYEDEVPF